MAIPKVPAAGNRNGSSLNNAGTNGNYWSSTPNASNSNNAYNLNFNSSNHNVNNNNRYNGRSVRPVSELTTVEPTEAVARHFSISSEQLLLDLYRAYKAARRHKRSREYQLRFEFKLEENLILLRDELLSGSYRPQPLTCFMIHDPKMREVFAADFRDRIVHHLLYNYIHTLFERQFVADSYSCIKGRGTHCGIKRLKHHINSASCGYTRPCYVLKVDIRGYFMHINRDILLRLCREKLQKMKSHPSDTTGKTWGEKLDYDFVDYLLEKIITVDPTENCRILGDKSEWSALPPDKSIFHADEHCGLPIGNLSSQLFSNIYMNELDQYAKRELGCRHYGRYVDDVFVVSTDRNYLRSLIPKLSEFLHDNLCLSFNEGKTQIVDVRHGVEFLGAFIKPFRTYIASKSWRRMQRKVLALPTDDARQLQQSVNSYLGVMSHYDSYCLRRVFFGYVSGLSAYGKFNRQWLIFRADPI